MKAKYEIIDSDSLLYLFVCCAFDLTENLWSNCGFLLMSSNIWRFLFLLPFWNRESAPPDKVKEAHRKVMVANHPDAGGSHYLASKINEAKDVLLGKTKGGGSAFWLLAEGWWKTKGEEAFIYGTYQWHGDYHDKSCLIFWIMISIAPLTYDYSH